MKFDTSQLMHDLNVRYFSILHENRNNGKKMTRMQICLLISEQHAPRFYVTLEYARRIINAATNGISRTRISHSRRNAMHQEIYKRYKHLPINEQNNIGLAKILDEQAPSFYFSARQISNILYKSLR